MGKKLGQMWFADFFIALLIFFFVLISYYIYTANISKQSSSVFDELISETKTISPALLQEGNPSTWTNETVIRIGLTKNDGRIDNALLIEASKINYNRTKKLLGVVHEFFVFFENRDGKIITFAGEFGLGNTEVIFNSSVNMAYYYHQEGQDDLMLTVMTELEADIYFGTTELAILLDNIDNYDFILLEDCHCDNPAALNALQRIEDWVFEGGLAFLSEHHHNQFPNTIMGVNTDKGDKGDGGTTNASVISTDPLLTLELDAVIEFEKDVIELVDDPGSEDAIDFTIIAEWDDSTSPSSGTAAIAKWGFGQGDVYYFPDYHATFLEEDFFEVVEDAIKNTIYRNGFIQINDEYDELVKTDRLVLYNSEIIKMVTYVWE